MTESIREKRGFEGYVEPLDRQRLRVFDADLPAGHVAHIETLVKVDVRRLDCKDQESATWESSEWFRQFSEKAKTRDALEKLRQSLARLCEPISEREVDATCTAPTLAERLEQLTHLCETDPATAASAIVAGVTAPNNDPAWRRVLVIAAEGVRFTEAQDRELIPALVSFINRLRDSNDREDQIAVCSAIRTYVGLIATAQVDSVAPLLEPGHRALPALDTVLETVKMITRKLSANPPAAANEHPQLSSQLERLARAYINPYVLPHGKHAAVAMNALQSLAGLGSPGMHEAVAEVNANCPAWFCQQLQRRLRRLLSAWEAGLHGTTVDHAPTILLRAVIPQLRVDEGRGTEP